MTYLTVYHPPVAYLLMTVCCINHAIQSTDNGHILQEDWLLFILSLHALQ